MLERSFPSSDKIKSVYQFVRSSLIAEALDDKFILCALLVDLVIYIGKHTDLQSYRIILDRSSASSRAESVGPYSQALDLG